MRSVRPTQSSRKKRWNARARRLSVSRKEELMQYVKIMKTLLDTECPEDRTEVFDLVLPCSDEDHQHHLFKEIIASFDNNMDWACERSHNGFREYRHRDFRSEWMAIIVGHDDNPHWEPRVMW
jgi:hypothetical protein